MKHLLIYLAPFFVITPLVAQKPATPSFGGLAALSFISSTTLAPDSLTASVLFDDFRHIVREDTTIYRKSYQFSIPVKSSRDSVSFRHIIRGFVALPDSATLKFAITNLELSTVVSEARSGTETAGDVSYEFNEKVVCTMVDRKYILMLEIRNVNLDDETHFVLDSWDISLQLK